jgi:sugar O-acyltransferase (sialic acid O-acetyltransferase NeuD family)
VKVLIFGAGGLGREVLNVFRASAAAGRDMICHGFIVDSEFTTAPTLHDMPVYGDLSILGRDQDIRVVVAVGDPSRRRAAAEKIENMVGPRFASAIHPVATIGREVRIDTGVMVLGPASITTDVSIGRHVVINPLVTISHDCGLADYVTLAPGVAIAGGVEVAEGAELGTGAKVIPRLTVGAWSVVGAGATVIRSVAANSTVAGVPARQISVRSPGWHDRQLPLPPRAPLGNRR